DPRSCPDDCHCGAARRGLRRASGGRALGLRGGPAGRGACLYRRSLGARGLSHRGTVGPEACPAPEPL
ncbi:MAG: hypothetical protein AVDCRST_MAG15-18, partial [uncultured Rubellimicrobium sp.]